MPLPQESRASLQDIRVLEDDFYYDKADFVVGDVSAKLMPNESLSLFYSFGFESLRRNNLHYLTDTMIASVVGNVLVFVNLRTMEQDYLPGLGNGAIGSIAVHPSRRFIAVGEIAESSPNIYIFEYPTMKLYRVLREGAEKGITNLSFNTAGDKLASVGMDPDYMLTLWDWKQEKVVLRSKAFSQDVYAIAFSPESDGQLTTSGMGHIKFWRMASTFTGLKLQGYIGKFGLSELTDIVTFIQLPDGKVLSSTETGNLLLWDGGMIKCELSGQVRKPCHDGPVEVILLVDGEVFTGGEDGYIRVWDFDTIDTADVISTGAPSAEAAGDAAAPDGEGPASGSSSSPQARVFEMEPSDEFFIGEDVKIRSVVRCPGENTKYLIQDQSGNLLSFDTQKRATEKLMSFHAGAVTGVDASPVSHCMASLGAGGTLKLYDYISKVSVNSVRFESPGTTLLYFPESLDRLGCTMAAGFADGVLRIVSHTPLSSGIDPPEFTLQYVFKPHKAPITSIGVSADGTYLATTASDCTAFFFKIDLPPDDDENIVGFSNTTAKIHPIGFITFASIPSKISFSPDNHLNIDEIEPVDDARLEEDEMLGEELALSKEIKGKRAFVVLENGELLSITVPARETVDNSVSYELNSDIFRITRWVLDVPPPPRPAKPQPKEGSSEETSSETPAAGREDPEQEPEKTQDTVKPGRMTSALRKAHGLVVENASPITNVLYLEGGYFLISLLNKDGEFEIRACKYGTPKQSRLVLVYRSKFSDMRLSTTGKYLLTGTVDGMSCLRKFRLEDILLYRWTGGHEAYSQYSTAFEEEEAHASVQKVSEKVDETDSRGDLDVVPDAPGQYWFGHAHNARSGKITSIVTAFDDSFLFTGGADGGLFAWRVTLEHIKGSEVEVTADALPPSRTVADILDPNEYTMQDAKLQSEKDKEYADAQRKKQVMREYIKELRSEFTRLVADNERAAAEEQLPRDVFTIDPDLRSDIKNDTEQKVERVQKELQWVSEKESIIPMKLRKRFLDPLKTERVEIHAFRSSHAIATFRTLKPEHTLDNILQPLGSSEAQQSVDQSNDAEIREPDFASKNASQEMKANENLGAGAKGAGKPVDARSKLEARKQLRAQRAIKWKELMDTKPDENYEDARDISAIRFAEQNLSARPEVRYEVTPEDIAKLRQDDLQAASDKKGNHEEGFGGFGGKPGGTQAKDVAGGPSQEPAQQPSPAHTGAGGSRVTTSGSGPSILDDLLLDEGPKLKAREEEMQMKRLTYERNEILSAIDRAVADFDNSVHLLEKEKTLLEGDLKSVDIKLLLLYREWVLLKEFEKHDNFLADKLVQKRGEKKDIDTKIKECQEKLNGKKADIEVVIQKERTVHDEFRQLLGENNKHEEFLTKIFKRKVKRSKKKAKPDGQTNNHNGGEDDQADADEDEEEDEDMDDMDDVESMTSDNDGEDLVEECPPEFDASKYKRILELREDRLDQEECLTEIQKAVDALKKENDSFIKKEKIIDQALKATENEIQQFQTQKQQKLNELDVVLPLRLHQIQYIDKQTLPTDLSGALVFMHQGLIRLRSRIKELQQEKAEIRRQHRELKKMHVNLIKSRREKQAKLHELEARAVDVQMLKFGKIIDLEKLERMGFNKNADELREKLTKEDAKRMKELEELQLQINKLKVRLTEVTRENTLRLENLVDLTDTKQSLEEALNTAQSSVTAEYSAPQEREILERQKIIGLVQSQAEEIAELKREIEILIRKPLRQLPPIMHDRLHSGVAPTPETPPRVAW
ncbi:uncharacterized protein EV422DRAFT_496817 [Fimicolochytrium jonesii]|uniref:uncharacterized protein n=1 Tax=Fimicolochytrium jonesii TaxID=1396493 RepID=UPI0022FE6FD6|nr:uncharacterized protein EV422DRAFT_496817 [Fimicolochytrium jonesii]KAI8820502.1 hypothetical protein EV422DRAFT_496817 [Fimicolochytrium jonesii]